MTWPLFGSNVKSSLHIYSTYLHTTYLHIYPQCRGVEARRAVTPAAGARLLSAGWWEHLLSRTGAARSAPTHHNNTITIYSNTGVLNTHAAQCSMLQCPPLLASGCYTLTMLRLAWALSLLCLASGNRSYNHHWKLQYLSKVEIKSLS